jgi:ATP-dependent protease ClpP protease subunit
MVKWIVLLMVAAPLVAAEARTITLYDKNTIALRMPITDDTAAYIQQELIKKSKEGAKEVYLTLYSPGGSITAGQMIVETAKGLGIKVHTISIFSASMSFIISQALDSRYVLDSTTMMSHRGYIEGLAGNVPGSLVSRISWFLDMTDGIDSMVAKRAGMPKDAYKGIIADELWMTGSKAVLMGFADELIRIKCDRSLEGDAPALSITNMIFELEVVFSKCPLLLEPSEIKGKGSIEERYNRFEQYIEQSLPRGTTINWSKVNRNVGNTK